MCNNAVESGKSEHLIYRDVRRQSCDKAVLIRYAGGAGACASGFHWASEPEHVEPSTN